MFFRKKTEYEWTKGTIDTLTPPFFSNPPTAEELTKLATALRETYVEVKTVYKLMSKTQDTKLLKNLEEKLELIIKTISSLEGKTGKLNQIEELYKKIDALEEHSFSLEKEVSTLKQNYDALRKQFGPKVAEEEPQEFDLEIVLKKIPIVIDEHLKGMVQEMVGPRVQLLYNNIVYTITNEGLMTSDNKPATDENALKLYTLYNFLRNQTTLLEGKTAEKV